jgi:retinol dehydrogenase-12/retinol dehydrogenase-13
VRRSTRAKERRPGEQCDCERAGQGSHYIILRMSEVRASTYSGAASGGSADRDAPMRGRVCLVTGANRGLGKATALGLARLGGTVLMLGRDAARVALASDDVRRESGNPDVSYLVADLGSLESVRQAAGEVARRRSAIHVLVNNAGVNLARRATSPDGIELTFAVNHVGPFLLTNLLVPLLRAGTPSRVVNVTSWFERFGRMDFDDVRGTRRRYRPLHAYYRSKLANVLFTYELAARLVGTGVTVNCVDPGLVATDLLRDRAWWSPRWLQPVWRKLLLTPDEGARAAIHVASSPEIEGVTGQCLDAGGRRKRTSERSYDEGSRARLWRLSEQLTAPAGSAAGR